MPLSHLIMAAYDIEPAQLKFAPGVDLLEGVKYDIEARAEGAGAPGKDAFKLMIRDLLVKRFGVRFHREMKETKGFALVAGKDGPKFHVSPPVDTPENGVWTKGRRTFFEARGEDVDALARTLSYVYLDFRLVVNETGLKGLYNFNLAATPESKIGDDPDAETVTIFSAVREQLGLRLEPRNVPTERFVVDAAHKPSVD